MGVFTEDGVSADAETLAAKSTVSLGAIDSEAAGRLIATAGVR